MLPKPTLAILGAFLLVTLVFTTSHTTRADSIITNCNNNTQFNTALETGGNITFNCGKATITFNEQKTIDADTSIDGGGKIIFSGANSTRLFTVGAGKTLQLKNLSLKNGKTNGAPGGCILVNGGTLVIQNSTIQNCVANNQAGGAIASDNGDITLDTVTMKNNQAAAGGALDATGTVTIFSSQFSANRATGIGGALSLTATATISNSTLSGNTAAQGGGISNGGSFMLVNVTLSQNSAKRDGGITNYGNLALLNSSLVDNSSEAGGALGWYGCITCTLAIESPLAPQAPNTLTIKNTLIAKGTQGANCYGVSGGTNNLSDDNSCAFGTGRDNVALNLAPLAYNGTVMPTHLPKSGSPVIDNGTDTGAPATDARGAARPQGAATDVGAVEVCAVNPDKPILETPANNATVRRMQVALNFQDSHCADRYKIVIKDAAGGAKVQNGTSGTSNFKSVTLAKGKTYKWFVHACNAHGCTKSDTWKFTIK